MRNEITQQELDSEAEFVADLSDEDLEDYLEDLYDAPSDESTRAKKRIVKSELKKREAKREESGPEALLAKKVISILEKNAKLQYGESLFKKPDGLIYGAKNLVYKDLVKLFRKTLSEEMK